MRIVGFNYTKISIEKTKSNFKDLKLETVMNIEEIEEIPNKLINVKESFLKIKFNYFINYNPEIAKIELKGELILALDQKMSKDILKDWKDKKIDEKIRIGIFNGILKKTNLKALELEESLGLPFHFAFPSLKSKK